jgi:hypothetical protein
MNPKLRLGQYDHHTENPEISIRNLARQLEIPVSKSSIQRILKTKKYHPYKISLHQELSQVDKENRINFCRHMLQRLEQQPNFPFFILFCDESTFKSSSVVNRHNMHYWSTENPRCMSIANVYGQ